MEMDKMRKRFYKLSVACLIVAVIVFIINYFVFHYVTDDGITFVWHPEAGKPFVTDLIGFFGVLFIWSSAMSLIISLVFFKKEK